VLTSTWPTEAPLSTFDITLNDKGVTLDAQYEGERELGAIALDLITRQLQAKLGLPNLALKARRVQTHAKASSAAAAAHAHP
jgi:hypothetical protein